LAENDVQGKWALPDGWVWAAIGDMVGADGVFTDGDWVESKDQDPQGDVRLVQLADIGDGVYRNKSDRYLTSAKAAELGCKFLKPGDVLIARMPDPLGRACIFPGDPKPCVTAVDVCIVHSGNQGVDHRWLMLFINSPQIRAEIASYQSGSTRKRISRSNLARILFPVPPLPEQRRIVAEIETQFTRLDAGVAALERARANLRRYKATVLKSACEGRLVPTEAELARAEGRDYEPAGRLLARILAQRRARWEAEHPGKQYEEPNPPDTENLPELPEGWVWASLERLSWHSNYGTSQKCDYEVTEAPVLRIPNIVNGTVDLQDLKYATMPQALGRSDELAPGDLLIVRTNGSRDLIGRSALVRTEFNRPYFFASYLIRFRIIQVSDWIATIWDAPFMREWLERAAATSAGQYNISVGTLNHLPIPIPPLAEQRRIVAEVERRLSVVAALEVAVVAALARARRLRRAVLERAFEGRLVPQDPSDEPASVLLERIKAERAQREKKGDEEKQPKQMELL